MPYFLVFIFCIFSQLYIGQIKPDWNKIDDAVVLIMIYDHQGNPIGHGSGFIIDDKGTVVTNYHVVKGATTMKVYLDNNGNKEIFDVDKIISGDDYKDLAKISIKNTKNKTFPYLIISKELPKKGDDCWAIGTPADPEYMNTISEGLVSNLKLGDNPKIIQTNAEITHGSSGGALFNNKGQVIGVTSAGDESSDGARASINFAIWIGEIDNLNLINKTSLINPNSIPCQLSFYTNSPYIGSVYLYVDGIYLGTFSKYFPSIVPTCGANGTITKFLYAGIHSYSVYYASTRQTFNGTINLLPGQCQIFKVQGPNLKTQNNDPSIFPGKIFENKNEFNWIVYSGYSFSPYSNEALNCVNNSNSTIPIPFFIERNFQQNKFALRNKIEFFQGGRTISNTSGETGNCKVKYYAFLSDLKFIRNKKSRFNYWVAPTMGYCYFKKTVIDYFNWDTGQIETNPVQIIENNKSGLSYGVKVGLDIYLTRRFLLSSDWGVLRYNGLKEWSSNFNIILGYKFSFY